MMGVGKTTLGKIVAKRQKLEFIDIDENIVKRNAMEINEIFEKKGETFFRSEERKEILQALKKNSCVIALGGGAFIDETIRNNILKETISIWLHLDIEQLKKRVEKSNKRPLLNKGDSEEVLKVLYSERKNIYKLANFKIECANLDKDEIVEKILKIYERN